MAIVTEPIALDRSLNTTEPSSRNLADVLAQALQILNTTISGLNFINCVVVPSLPTTGISTTTIYLVPKNPSQTDNLYDEYINLTGTSAGWEKIGDTEIDLSDYYNKTETDTLLSGKVDKVNGKGLSTNDYTDAEKTKLAGIEAGAEVNPTSSAKTATESFETANGGLLSKCMIDLVPVQSGSGDPSPDNVRPISGHTEVGLYNVGKNWFNKDNYKFVKNSYIDGNNAWVGNTTILTYPDDALSNYWNSVLIDLTPYSGKTITYSRFVSANGTYRGLLDKDFNVLAILGNSSVASQTVDLSQYPTAKYLALAFIKSSYNFDSAQLELGSTATSYEPYLGHLYQVQIGSTVYGGYVDLVSGELIPNIAKKVVSANDITNSSGVFVGRHFTNANYIPNPETARLSFWCNAYKAISASSSEEVGEVYISASGQLIFNTMYADINDFKTWINNNELYICYQIENPTPIQLTPQQIEALVGQNNLSTPLDGQSIETNGVEYKELFTFADVEKVVSLRVPISMLGTDESGKTTASQSYASGDYFYKDGYMCKALTSISAGATLTLNTNYSQGTLADILKAIENA